MLAIDDEGLIFIPLGRLGLANFMLFFLEAMSSKKKKCLKLLEF